MSDEVQKKNKKPIYKRTWFIVVAAFILVSAVSNAFTSDEQSPSASISSEAQQTAVPSESPTNDISESGAEPTETAAPTETAEPTETAAPTETAEPTETAAPTQSAEPTETATQKPTTTETTGQKNAKRKAESYLDYSFFSRSGLIDQLLYEDFSRSDAEYAVDAVDANWKLQAAGKAESYLSYSAFSRSGLVDQLLYEGYTSSEAEYGVASTNADWNVQAAKKAKSYLEYSSFSRQGLIDQLKYEGFSQSQAEYGVSQNGY